MPLRPFLHVVIAVLSWLLFGFYWWIVSRRQLNPTTVDAVQLLAVVVVVLWLLTALWVWHNVRLFRDREDRRVRRTVGKAGLDRDYLGRHIEIRGGAPITNAPYIVVRLEQREGDDSPQRKRMITGLPPGEVARPRGGAA